MPSYSTVTVLGHIVRDPRRRETTTGTAVTEADIAINHRYTDPAGKTQEDTCYLTIVTFARQAETLHKYGSKGRLLLAAGRLRQDRWEDNNGTTHSKVYLQAARVIFCDAPKKPAPSQMTPNTN